tara:strand:+ start:3203 stop:4528 length:1326 start_codon:yes stop_codon:yes gene_type:complete
MIIPDLSEQSIVGSIKKWIDESHVKEREDRINSMNYYEGINLEEETRKWFDRNALNYAPPMAVNITKKLIDSRFIAYKTAPERRADDRYLDVLGDLDHDMVEADRLTGLLGTIAMLRFYDEERQVMDSHILTDFEPIFVPNNPNPVGIIYPLFSHGQAKENEQEWVYWSDEAHFKMLKGGRIIHVNEQDVNPYGEMPILWSHLYPMMGNEWWRTGKGVMVANSNQLYNVFGTQLSLGNMYQSLGQSVLTGVDDGATRLRMDVSKLLVLPEGANYSIVSPSGSLNEIRENMKWVVETTAHALHLKVKWGSDAGSTSGEHQRILEVDLTEAVMADFERWRKFEKQRFNLDRVILDSHNVKVGEEYSINFSEPHIPLSPQQEREEWEWKWNNGLATKKDWFRHYNPDMNDTQIDERLGEAQAETQAQAEVAQPAQSLVERLVNA